KTHSTATLKNVKSIKKPVSNGKIEVFCYLKKSEVNKIFQQRKKLISEIVSKAHQYEQEYNYAHALKNYYFANILLNSLSDQNVIYNGRNYTTLIPNKIHKILLNTNFKYVNKYDISANEMEVTLKVLSNGHPISLLDFTFWDGRSQVNVQAKDGIASLRLVGSSIDFKKLRVNIKYSYYQCRKEYNVIADLWDLVLKPVYRGAKVIKLEKKKKKNLGIISKPIVVSKTDDFNIQLKTDQDSVPLKNIGQSTQKLLKLINNNNISKIKRSYSNDNFLKTKVVDYLKYNNAKPQDRNIGAKVNKTENGWEVRKIRMLHNYPSIHKQSTEYMVLDFSKDGELRDINIAITKQLYDKFVKQGKFGRDWDNRQQIIKFLEKYRTAYMSRDINTVEKMFAEDALIIVGRKIKRKKISPEEIYNKFGNEPDYEYIRMKKEEYNKRQKQVFDHQKDIFLDFASFEINRKNNQPSVYGVEMRQNYFSTTYSDEGYLFLLIDFSKEDPTIYVRAWQPNEWDEDKLISSGNFKVYK
ncbi:MAG: hypothetical protein U9R41_04210, partial [Candidatus Marinimicrobia bacterium]|nr:hypothetical protein [Candidatus Neomarinimicrobiota bacterium]